MEIQNAPVDLLVGAVVNLAYYQEIGYAERLAVRDAADKTSSSCIFDIINRARVEGTSAMRSSMDAAKDSIVAMSALAASLPRRGQLIDVATDMTVEAGKEINTLDNALKKYMNTCKEKYEATFTKCCAIYELLKSSGYHVDPNSLITTLDCILNLTVEQYSPAILQGVLATFYTPGGGLRPIDSSELTTVYDRNKPSRLARCYLMLGSLRLANVVISESNISATLVTNEPGFRYERLFRKIMPEFVEWLWRTNSHRISAFPVRNDGE